MIKHEIGASAFNIVVLLLILAVAVVFSLDKLDNIAGNKEPVSPEQSFIEATAGALSASINLARAQHEAEGRPGSVSIDGKTIYFGFKKDSSSAWPVGSKPLESPSEFNNPTICVSIFQALVKYVTASVDDSGDFQVDFVKDGSCSFKFVTRKEGAHSSGTITYDALTGRISLEQSS